MVEFKELHWFCPKCDQTAIRATQQLNNSSRSDNILSAVTSTISTAIQSLQDTLKTTIQNLVTATVSKPIHQSASNMETDAEVSNSEDFLLENITSSLANEQKEREKQKLNVIVYNVPESNATTGLERKEEGLTRLNGLFKDYLQVSPDITKVIRLGKKDDKPRLLKVSVASIDQRSNILRNKVKFKQDSNPEHVKNIYISPDFTPLEQRRRKALCEQLKKMNNVANLCYKKRLHSAEGEDQLSQPFCTDNIMKEVNLDIPIR